MKKQLFVLLCCVLSMTATMTQSTNSNDDLLKQGVSNRQAKKEAQNKQDRQLYWLGKVPVKDGIVVFEKTLVKESSDVYATMKGWLDSLVARSNHEEVSQIAADEPAQGVMIANICETMYFKKSKWETDFTDFYYQIVLKCKGGQCQIQVKDIQYRYEEMHEVKGAYLKAEDWITDEAAFNKDKTKLLKEPGKFRRKTIQRIQEIFDSAAITLK